MAALDIPRLGLGQARDTSPSGRSEASDISIDDGPDAALAHRGERSPRRYSFPVLRTFMRPKRKGQTEKAFDQWDAKQRRPMIKLLILLVSSFITIIILIIAFAYTAIHLSRHVPANDVQRIVASWGKPGTATASLADYPTQLTGGIDPIPCHSHNDYTRKVPLYDALNAGCESVEADIWFSPRDLLVGHTIKSLTETRTLRSLYLAPLFSLLSHQNPSDVPLAQASATAHATTSTLPPHGIWDASPSLPLILLIDFKNDPKDSFRALQRELEPLRSKGWLTTYDGTSINSSLITVVGTGDAPFDLIVENATSLAQTPRYIFYDAPLADLWGEVAPPDNARYNSTNSYYASTNFEASIGKPWHGILTPGQVEKIRGQIAEAHARGLKVRYWNTPRWPRSQREHVWDVLVKEGVDMLNVDDLLGARERKWQSR